MTTKKTGKPEQDVVEEPLGELLQQTLLERFPIDTEQTDIQLSIALSQNVSTIIKTQFAFGQLVAMAMGENPLSKERADELHGQLSYLLAGIGVALTEYILGTVELHSRRR